MAICVETVEKCDPQDVRTPVFVFERLCSIIYPEENDVGEFYMNLDKDPQQEDFLQVCVNRIHNSKFVLKRLSFTMNLTN